MRPLSCNVPNIRFFTLKSGTSVTDDELPSFNTQRHNNTESNIQPWI